MMFLHNSCSLCQMNRIQKYHFYIKITILQCQHIKSKILEAVQKLLELYMLVLFQNDLIIFVTGIFGNKGNPSPQTVLHIHSGLLPRYFIKGLGIRGTKGAPLPRLCFAQLPLSFNYYLCYEKCYVHTYIRTDTHNYLNRFLLGFPQYISFMALLSHQLKQHS